MTNGSAAQHGSGIRRLNYAAADHPYSQSIVVGDLTALIQQSKFFLHPTKHRLSDPSEIYAFDFTGEFQRSAICSVSATIGIYWLIFVCSPPTKRHPALSKKTVTRALITRVCRGTDIEPVDPREADVRNVILAHTPEKN